MVLGVAPVLIFDAWMPVWALVVALTSVPVLWLIRWLGRGSLTRPTPLDVPILILLVMVPVGVWASANVSLSVPELYRIVLGVALFYAVANTVADALRLRLVTVSLLVVTALLGLVALLSTHWGGGKFPVPFLDALYGQLPRLIQPFWNPLGFNPNIIGGALAMLLPMLIAFAVGARRWLVRVIWALPALIGCLALLLTQSRGAIVGLLLALLVMGLAHNRRFLLAVVASGVVGLVTVRLLGPAHVSRFILASGGESAVGGLEARLELWSRALYMIQDFPFTGVGLGMFDRVLDMLYPGFLLDLNADVYHPHNAFLAQAVTAGLPGLIAFLALILLLLFMALRSIHLSRGEESYLLSIGLLGAWVAYLSHGLLDSMTSFIKAHTILWGLFGLQAALWAYLLGRQRQASPNS